MDPIFYRVEKELLPEPDQGPEECIDFRVRRSYEGKTVQMMPPSNSNLLTGLLPPFVSGFPGLYVRYAD